MLRIVFFLFVMFFILGCQSEGEGTIDIVTGLYKGTLAQELMKNSVEIVETSTLSVEFSEDSGSLVADVTFTGKVKVFAIPFKGPDSDTIVDVTVDGDDLTCAYVADTDLGPHTFNVEGLFQDHDLELFLTISDLGSINLKLVPDV